MSAVLQNVTNAPKASGKHKKKAGAKQHQHQHLEVAAPVSDSSALPSPHNGPVDDGHDGSGDKDHIREVSK
jgi:hypothetical protein